MTHLRTHLLPLFAALLIIVLFSGCGKQKTDEDVPEDTPAGPQIMEVKITGANFYDYFDYKEYQATPPTRTGTSPPATSVTASPSGRAMSRPTIRSIRTR